MMSVELLWKGTAILVAAFATARLTRRSPAALRHFIWTAAFAALLVLPVGLFVDPQWKAPLEVPIAAAPAVTTRIVATPQAPATGSPISLSTVWWIGFGLAAARFLAGAARMTWMIRRGKPSGAADGVPVIGSELAAMPS
jgi:hypothetical protein